MYINPRKKFVKKIFSFLKKRKLLKTINMNYSSNSDLFTPKFVLDFKGQEKLKIYEINKKTYRKNKFIKPLIGILFLIFFGKKIYDWKNRRFFGKVFYPIFFLMNFIALIFYFNYIAKTGKLIYLKNCGTKICYNSLLNNKLREISISEQSKFSSFGAEQFDFDFLALTDNDDLYIFDNSIKFDNYVLDWDLFRAVLNGKDINIRNDPNEVYIDI